MRPLLLKGHDRSLTKVKYNKDGDLLFTAAKDKSPSVWFSDNGERLGSYDGHTGVIWCMDISWDSRHLITGGGDNMCAMWDVETGQRIHSLTSPVSVRTIGFSYSGNLFFYGTDMRMIGNTCTLNFYDKRDADHMTDGQPLFSILCPYPKSKISSALWSHLDYMVITGHEMGEICQFDIRMTKQDRQDLTPVNFVNEHKRQIMDLQISHDQCMILSASKDQTAKLFDAKTLEKKKTYISERPVNSAAMSPVREHVILGGGEEAMQVTQTDTRLGQFEAKLYHMVFEEEFARIKGHFGPINTIAFHPSGKSFASGGEDGMVRIQTFDDDYWEFDFDY